MRIRTIGTRTLSWATPRLSSSKAGLATKTKTRSIAIFGQTTCPASSSRTLASCATTPRMQGTARRSTPTHLPMERWLQGRRRLLLKQRLATSLGRFRQTCLPRVNLSTTGQQSFEAIATSCRGRTTELLPGQIACTTTTPLELRRSGLSPSRTKVLGLWLSTDSPIKDA